MSLEFVSTKTFENYPCAHRQWKHHGNCKVIHGYSRSFHFVFAAHNQDACGFIVDFGDLDWLKGWLEHMFDHTLLLAADDPYLDQFKALDAAGVCQLRVMPTGVGMEDTAAFVCTYADEVLRTRSKGRCWIVSVEARENNKNSAIYFNPEAGFKGWTS